MFFGGMPGGMPHMNGHGSRSNGPVDTTLYELLGVAPTATDDEIKKVRSGGSYEAQKPAS